MRYALCENKHAKYIQFIHCSHASIWEIGDMELRKYVVKWFNLKNRRFPNYTSDQIRNIRKREYFRTIFAEANLRQKKLKWAEDDQFVITMEDSDSEGESDSILREMRYDWEWSFSNFSGIET